MVITPENRLWRTLVRFEEILEDQVIAVIPGWNASTKVSLSIESLPDWLQSKMLNLPYRAYVMCNIGQEDPSKLVFEGWEL